MSYLSRILEAELWGGGAKLEWRFLKLKESDLQKRLTL